MRNRIRRRGFCIIKCAVLLILFSFAEAKTLTLQDAVLLALRVNPNVHNAQMQRILDKYNLRLAEFEFEWQYQLTGSAAHTKATAEGARSTTNRYAVSPSANIKSAMGTTLTAAMANPLDGSGYRPQINLTIKQPLLRGVGREVVEKSLIDAYDNEYLNRLSLRDAIMNEVSDVENAYWDLVSARNNLKTQQEALDNAIRTVSENQALIKAGRIAPNENIQAESAVASQRLAVTQSQFSIITTKQSLLKAIGFIDLNMPLNVQNKLVHLDSPIPTVTKAMQIAVANNIDYQRLIMTVRQDERALLVARDNVRPTLDASVTTSFGGGVGLGGITDGRNKSTTLGLDFNIPIKNISGHKEIVAAKIQLEQDRVRLRQGKRDLEISIRQQINNLHNQEQQIQQAREAVTLANRSLKIERQKLNFGLSTAINVNTSRSNLINTELSLLNSQIGLLKGWIDFRKTLGITLEYWHIQLRY